jgi:hypothetical protein
VRYAYNVKPWSDEHFRLMARSFDQIRGFGNRTLYIPVRTKTDFGNEEGMVRWVKQADGSYNCDFSVMNRYLDTALAHMGKPRYTIFIPGGGDGTHLPPYGAYWHAGASWPEEDRKLFDMAAEVARALK